MTTQANDTMDEQEEIDDWVLCDAPKKCKFEYDYIIKGWLQTTSVYLNQFKRRWIVLSKSKKLYIYEGKEEYHTQIVETIDLDLFKYIKISQGYTPNHGQFELILQKHTWNGNAKKLFIAKTVENMNLWIECIRKVSVHGSIHHKSMTDINIDYAKIQEIIVTQYAQLIQNKKKKKRSVQININTRYWLDANEDKYKHKFLVCAGWIEQETIKSITDATIKYLNKKYHPTQLEICYVDGFTGYIGSVNDKTYNQSIISYWDYFRGLSIDIKVKYEKNVFCTPITCRLMKNMKTKDPLKCVIYRAMMKKQEWNEENMNHLIDYTHFEDEFNAKAECKYNYECKAYKRLENGGNELEDQCHLKLYRHPPRTRNITLSENIQSLIIHKSTQQNHKLYEASIHAYTRYKWSKSDGWLLALMEEVIINGYKYDLCVYCGMNDMCKHKECSILQMVEDKLNHRRYKMMGSPLDKAEMLSLIMYTGCDCNYDLCLSQRNGDYNKWKWFDYCLYNAIRTLSLCETGSFSVFSGLSNVKLDVKSVSSGCFVTYISTSWNKTVANAFVNGDGMMIQIDKEFKNHNDIYCCDVSWISKFSDECEILFARSLKYTRDEFKCTVLDDTNGMQTISLTKKTHT